MNMDDDICFKLWKLYNKCKINKDSHCGKELLLFTICREDEQILSKKQHK